MGELLQLSAFEPFVAPGAGEAAGEGLARQPLLPGAEVGPDPQCTGRWAYTTFDCFKEGVGPVCGVEPADRDAMVVDLEEERENLYSEVVRPSAWDWWWGVVKEDDTPDDVARVTKRCSEYWQKAHPKAGDDEAVVECFELSRAPTPKRAGVDVAWGNVEAWRVVWRGKMRILRPARPSGPSGAVYGTCRHPQFGREASNVCGAPESLVISEPGLRRSELDQEHGDVCHDGAQSAQCLTCDDWPERQKSDLVAKLDCLNNNLRFAQELGQHANAEDDEGVHPQQLVDEIRAQGAALWERLYSLDPSAENFW